MKDCKRLFHSANEERRAMTVDLQKLNNAVEFLANQDTFAQAVNELSHAVVDSPEPFVWSVVDLNSIKRELPAEIKSCWIFVLKKDVPSGCHYHPNSVQHMVMIKGQGTSKVGEDSRRMLRFRSPNALEDVWYVIGKGVPHEFFPEREDMTVVSFHTCKADKLEEVACDTGEKRFYEATG
jgi:mannose-6-phosphate isomerase-like protein (cupin superfamily)